MAYKNKSETFKYNNEFNKQAYDRISLIVAKGKRQVIQSAAQSNGESVNAFINRLIDAEIERIERLGGIFHISPPSENDKEK